MYYLSIRETETKFLEAHECNVVQCLRTTQGHGVEIFERQPKTTEEVISLEHCDAVCTLENLHGIDFFLRSVENQPSYLYFPP